VTKLWSTAVSSVRPDSVILRGYPLEDVMAKLSYAAGAYLTIVGELPSPAQTKMLDAMLCSLLDHGFVASSITAARFIASGNPALSAAVAGGVLTAGANTISPAHSAQFIRAARRRQQLLGVSVREVAAQVVAEELEAKRRIPGLGHPTYRGEDPRAVVLKQIAQETGYFGAHGELFEAIWAEFGEVTGKRSLCLNVDGRMASIMLDMGLDADQMLGFALISVLPGIVAHSIEEIRSGSPLRVLPEDQYNYTGPPLRQLPNGLVSTSIRDGNEAGTNGR
jgi:citrate synthase